MPQLLTYLFVGLYSLTIAGIIAVIIADNRNPLKTMPWIIVLVFAPVVGLVFYFFFGQNLAKRRIIPRRTRRRITQRIEADGAAIASLPERHRPLAELLATTIHAVPLGGSRLTPYSDGRSKMEALLAEVARARHHIHVQYYILADDATGRSLRDALVARAREGVEVRVLYDDVGSVSVSRRFLESMRAAGIEVRPPPPPAAPGPPALWRDIHFRVEGPAVAGLQASFLSDWSATTRRHVAGAAYYPPLAPLGDGLLQLVAGGPFGKWRALLQAESYAVARARRRIWIQTPYYLPSEVLDTALQSAALAGIDVRLMLPERSDSRVVDLASHSYLDDMMKAGVKILLFRAGFLHSKLLLVDDDLTVVGSANMDFRSFEHNFEINAFVYDPSFAARMEALFERDAASCRALSPGEWFRRPRYLRFAESFMRLFAPLL